MTSSPRRNSFEQKLKDMETRLKRLERATNLVSASIGSGGLTIRNDGNLTIRDGGDLRVMDDGTFQLFSEDGTQVVMYVGGLELGGNSIGRGALFRSEDGNLIAIFSTNEIDGTTWASIYDTGGREAVGIDRQTGYGLAYPRHHYPFIKNDTAEYFSTVSGAFVLAYTGYATFSNPDLELGISATVSGVATGEVRILLDGVVQNTQSFSGASFLTHTINISDIAGANPDHQGQVQIQLRRVSGAGTVFCQPEYMVGRRNI